VSDLHGKLQDYACKPINQAGLLAVFRRAPARYPPGIQGDEQKAHYSTLSLNGTKISISQYGRLSLVVEDVRQRAILTQLFKPVEIARSRAIRID
jgi:hypothetical protein